MTKQVLVTGAGGFIGSHLLEELVRRGDTVRAFIHYNALGTQGWLDSLAPDFRDEFEVVAGDIRDADRVSEAVRGCDVVYHLAALIAIPYSYHAPASYVATNVMGTLHVMQAARQHGVERLVHTSTSEVYGTAQFIPISETHPLQAQSPYAATKIGADQLALSFQAAFGVPVTVLRPFNTYGPRQSARAVIPTIISQLAQGARSIQLGALHPTRDFNYVRDTVRGFLAAAAAEAAAGEVVNVGSGYEIAIGDLAHLIAEIMQTEIEIETEAERLRPDDSEVERLVADSTKAHALLGWTPAYAGREGLIQGLRETVAWFMQTRQSRVPRPGAYVL